MGADNPEDDQVPPGFEIRPVDLHLRGEVLVDPLVGEGGEIVEAPENFGRRLHPAEVELVLHPPDVPLAEGRPAAGDQVEIASAPGHVAGMEARRRLLHPENVDRDGEEVVETMEDLPRRETVRGIQMGDLGKGMNAGVGPAGPLDLHLSPEELPGGIDQGPLDAPRVFLHLPAAVAGPVILQRELVFARGRRHRLSATFLNMLPVHGFVSRFVTSSEGCSPRKTIPSRP